MSKIKFIILVLVLSDLAICQLFELTHNNASRYYWVDYPDNVNEPRPLIINMHGFSQTIESLINSSEMTYFAS